MTDQATVTNYTRRELTRFFASIAAASIVLHSIWEMAQMPAYKDLAGRPFVETAARCALAAGSIGWGLKSRWNVYLTLALLAALHAIWIEQVALVSGRWSYSNAMPIVPRLNVGVWPLLQLTLLTPLTIALASCFALRKPAAHGLDADKESL